MLISRFFIDTAATNDQGGPDGRMECFTDLEQR
jgi:hypothetical protein